MNKERLLSVNDLCEYIGIGRDTLYKLIRNKALPAYRLGRLWKFRKKEVDRWLKNGAQ
ncbi:MAG: helix-turn-helix domain-containing protein [Deltaproteobacteria bacterium]|nr:helix-turn-helix domain-containing protein [Deltaproteobacteria bacterium]OQY11062.1 MAG: transcriptional regulator [Desulfobacteraceae bacterium 4572_187]MBW1958343.1 helix-turn-helix domain-containing protein [Deltaproteobacteria bacterium]MBW2013038.1 helix-turn-helix domain-containing protein [Deltaproteobacteria bacterium]MBW2088598.1 helix-turn-helix domain-containing protein [Deltaproteobacteria bacterium]